MSRAAAADRRAQVVGRVQATCDIEELHAAASHPSWRVRRVVAAHALTPPELVARLAQDPSGRVRVRACVHPELDPAALTALAHDPWRVVRARVAGHRLAPLAALLALLDDRQLQWQVACRLEWIAASDVDAAVQMARSPVRIARVIAAASPHRAAHELLCWDQTQEIRSRLVSNPAVAEDLLLVLAGDDETAAMVAGRTDLPLPALRKLIDRGPQARRAVAAHPALRPGLAFRLARAQDSVVRAELVRHRSTPRVLRAWLLRDPHWSVLCAALEGPHVSRRLVLRGLRHRSAAVRCAAISSPLVARVRRQRLERAMDDGVVAQAAVVNPALPAGVLDDVLTRLIPDERKWPGGAANWIVGAALGNPAVPARQLVRLADAPAPAWAMRRLATNPSAPAEVSEPMLTMLALGAMEGDPRFDPISGAGNPGDPALHPWAETSRIAITEPLLRHPVPTVRASVASQAQEMTHADLLLLAEDPDIRVRAVVLRFRPLSEAVSTSMRSDPVPWIRDAVSDQKFTRKRSVFPAFVDRSVSPASVAWLIAACAIIAVVDPFDRQIDQLASVPQVVSPAEFMSQSGAAGTAAPLEPDVVAILVTNGRVTAIADGRTHGAWSCRNSPGERCGGVVDYTVGASGYVVTPRIETQLPPFPDVQVRVEAWQPPFESVTGLFVRTYFDLLPMRSSGTVITAFELECREPRSVVRISTSALADIPIEVGMDDRARRVMLVDVTGHGLAADEQITLTVDGHDETYQVV